MSNLILNDKDLEMVFADKKTRFLNSKFFKISKYAAAFLGTALLIFILLNFASIKKKFQYWLTDDFSPTTEQQTENPTEKPTKEPQISPITNNTIEISAISVTAPVIWDVPNTTKQVAEGLSRGVIQIEGTSKPGQDGNVFITGHSSNYPWAKGNYNQIFALLDKLVIGDQVKVAYDDKTYLYTVSEKKVVMPSETSIMSQTPDNRLTLMTCTPVGTNLKRLVVIASQTYPKTD